MTNNSRANTIKNELSIFAVFQLWFSNWIYARTTISANLLRVSGFNLDFCKGIAIFPHWFRAISNVINFVLMNICNELYHTNRERDAFPGESVISTHFYLLHYQLYYSFSTSRFSMIITSWFHYETLWLIMDRAHQ